MKEKPKVGEKKEEHIWERGYFCALSCIIIGHGYETPVREALRCIADPKKGVNINEYDYQVLKDCGALKDIKRHRAEIRAMNT